MTKSGDQSTVVDAGRGEQTRRRILHAAMQLVAERGWDAATTRQIAERAEANQALIHYHFGSKEKLLHAAFAVALRDLFAGPMEALTSAPSLAEGAAALVRALGSFDESAPEALFSMEALARATRDEEVRRDMAEALAELRAVVADRIAAGKASGELDAGLDPVGVATVLGALFDGLGLHLLIDRSIDVDRAAAALAALLAPAATTHLIPEQL